METINYKGNTYQIGALYDFSDNGFDWFTCELGNINRLSKYVFETSRGDYSEIKALDSEIGTITPTPIDLIDGKAYQFQASGGVWLGFYQESRKSFFTQFERGNKICSTTEASNIQPLTVEIK